MNPKNPQAAGEGLRPKGFGIACTVAWTELHQAIIQDGIDVTAGKCGPAVREWIVGVVRDTFAATPAIAPGGDAELSEHVAVREMLSGKSLYVLTAANVKDEKLPLPEIVFGMVFPDKVVFSMKDATAALPAPANAGAVDDAVTFPRWFVEKLARDADDLGMPKMAVALTAALAPAAARGGDVVVNHVPMPKPAPDALTRAAEAMADTPAAGGWHAGLGAAIERAAKKLPEGWTISIEVEAGAGWVELYDNLGNAVSIHADEGTLTDQVNDALHDAQEAARG